MRTYSKPAETLEKIGVQARDKLDSRNDLTRQPAVVGEKKVDARLGGASQVYGDSGRDPNFSANPRVLIRRLAREGQDPYKWRPERFANASRRIPITLLVRAYKGLA